MSVGIYGRWSYWNTLAEAILSQVQVHKKEVEINYDSENLKSFSIQSFS